MKKFSMIGVAILLCTLMNGCQSMQSVADQEPDAAYVWAEEHALPMYETYAVWEENALESVPTVHLP